MPLCSGSSSTRSRCRPREAMELHEPHRVEAPPDVAAGKSQCDRNVFAPCTTRTLWAHGSRRISPRDARQPTDRGVLVAGPYRRCEGRDRTAATAVQISHSTNMVGVIGTGPTWARPERPVSLALAVEPEPLDLADAIDTSIPRAAAHRVIEIDAAGALIDDGVARAPPLGVEEITRVCSPARASTTPRRMPITRARTTSTHQRRPRG